MMASDELFDLCERYTKLYPREFLSHEASNGIQNLLRITFPSEVASLLEFYGGGCLGGIEHYSFSLKDEFNVVSKTLQLRDKIGLPLKYMALAEPFGSTLIVLDGGSQSPTFGKVYWLDAGQIYELIDNQLLCASNEWEDYGEFFRFMLEAEEEMNNH